MDSIKIYSGSEILAQALQVKLQDVGIASWTKNNVQSAISAGFGIFNQTVDVYVASSDASTAKEIASDLNLRIC
ncbi:putative signal transducing protein [Flavobacterium sp. GCM10023249]|uniref:putative signal transducing protein n=1 Tax=unclassified Flavobacterium TaxID=196869 RepID=UPI00362311B3